MEHESLSMPSFTLLSLEPPFCFFWDDAHWAHLDLGALCQAEHPTCQYLAFNVIATDVGVLS